MQIFKFGVCKLKRFGTNYLSKSCISVGGSTWIAVPKENGFIVIIEIDLSCGRQQQLYSLKDEISTGDFVRDIAWNCHIAGNQKLLVVGFTNKVCVWILNSNSEQTTSIDLEPCFCHNFFDSEIISSVAWSSTALASIVVTMASGSEFYSIRLPTKFKGSLVSKYAQLKRGRGVLLSLPSNRCLVFPSSFHDHAGLYELNQLTSAAGRAVRLVSRHNPLPIDGSCEIRSAIGSINGDFILFGIEDQNYSHQAASDDDFQLKLPQASLQNVKVQERGVNQYAERPPPILSSVENIHTDLAPLIPCQGGFKHVLPGQSISEALDVDTHRITHPQLKFSIRPISTKSRQRLVLAHLNTEIDNDRPYLSVIDEITVGLNIGPNDMLTYLVDDADMFGMSGYVACGSSSSSSVLLYKLENKLESTGPVPRFTCIQSISLNEKCICCGLSLVRAQESTFLGIMSAEKYCHTSLASSSSASLFECELWWKPVDSITKEACESDVHANVDTQAERLPNVAEISSSDKKSVESNFMTDLMGALNQIRDSMTSRFDKLEAILMRHQIAIDNISERIDQIEILNRR